MGGGAGGEGGDGGGGEGGGGGGGDGGDGGGGNGGGGVNMQMHDRDEEHEPVLPPPKTYREWDDRKTQPGA